MLINEPSGSGPTLNDGRQQVHAEENLMRSYLIVFVVVAMAVFSTQAGAQQRGPSTAEERARAVQTAKSLQSDPLAPNVQEDREWLVKWLIGTCSFTRREVRRAIR